MKNLGQVWVKAKRTAQHLKKGQAHLFATPPNYAAAERSFRKAIGNDPKCGDAFHWLGSALDRQGKTEAACDAYRSAIRFSPSDPRPRIFLGWCLRQRGKYSEAVRWLEEGLALKPHYGEADARMMLAEVYDCLGRTDAAIAQWRHVVDMEPMYPSYDLPMEEAKGKLARHGL